MYCGHENEDASETCVKCGNQLMETPAPEQIPSDQEPAADAQETEQPQEIPKIQDPESVETQTPLDGTVDETYGAGTQDGVQQTAAQDGYTDVPYPGENGAVQGGTGYGYDQSGGVGYGYGPAGGVQYGGQGYGYPQEGTPYQPQDGYGQGGYDQGGYDQGYVQDGYGQGGYDQGYDQGGYDYETDTYADQFDPLLMKKARRRIRNPIGFLAMIFFTIYTVAEILNVALGYQLKNISTVCYNITRVAGNNVAVNFMNSVVKSIESVNKWYMIGGGLAFCLPNVLLLLGLWMAFCSISAKKEKVSTAGCTMARAAVIIKFILVCVLFLGGIIFAVTVVVTAGASSRMMSLIAGVIVLLILILLAVFSIMYYVQVLYSIKVIRANVRNGQDLGRIPGFAIFVGFIGCAVSAASMIPMLADDYIGLAAHGSYAVWLFLISLWAIIYKATVRIKRN